MDNKNETPNSEVKKLTVEDLQKIKGALMAGVVRIETPACNRVELDRL